MKKVLSIIMAVFLVFCMLSLVIPTYAYSSSRDDGIWLFPLPSSYYNNFSDWAGCPGQDKCAFCGTSHSGWGDSAHSGQGGHNGIDVAAAAGTSVYASADGIAYTFYNSERGNTVVIEHTIGNGYSYYTTYQHLSSYSVSNGQKVSAGYVIGKVGSTGDSGGNHLHFGMLIGQSGQSVGSSLLNKLEGYGWITTPGNASGRILNNPASSNDAGFPTGKSAVVAPLKAHYGSVHYTFDPNKVSIKSQAPITYTDIQHSNYLIKNVGNGGYLNVEGGVDAQSTNINTVTFNGSISNNFTVEIKSDSGGYLIRPHCSSSRVVNIYATTVVSGKNVCIYDNTGHDSQRWKFEKVSNGFVIRNLQNPSCVLDVDSSGNVYVNTYSGASSQIWQLQNYIVYYANGGLGSPEIQFKNYGDALNLSSTSPTRDGYTFLGWSNDSSATTPIYTAGSTYSANGNIGLYAVWQAGKSLTSVSVASMPNKTAYCIGDAFDYSGLTLMADYSDGTYEVVTSGFNVSSPDMTMAGTKTVTVTYEGRTATFDIVVSVVNSGVITVDSKTVSKGNTVSVDLLIKDNPGFVAFNVYFDYDKENLTLVNVENKLSNFNFTYNNTYVWDSLEDYTEDGVIATLTFEVAEGAPEADYFIYPVFISAANSKFESVNFVCESGTLTVTDIMYGDANGDGNINTVDLAIIKLYLANYNPATGETSVEACPGIDVNGDGNINTVDLAILKLYLANYNPSSGDSVTTLGPQ